MSHQGRGNAIIAAVVLVVCMVVLLCCEVAQGSNFTVGDAGGWTFSVSGWPNGKSFKAGDILVFNYPPGMHNVVVVGKADYDNCKVPNGAKTYTSGKDHISLAKGPNYFICGIPGHCQAGFVPSKTGRTDPRSLSLCPNDQAHRGTCTRVQWGTGSPPGNPLTSKLRREVDCRDRLEIEKPNLVLVFNVCLYPLVIISLSLPTCHLGRKSML